MNLENLVVSLETAKKLKAAGWNKPTMCSWKETQRGLWKLFPLTPMWLWCKEKGFIKETDSKKGICNAEDCPCVCWHAVPHEPSKTYDCTKGSGCERTDVTCVPVGEEIIP